MSANDIVSSLKPASNKQRTAAKKPEIKPRSYTALSESQKKAVDTLKAKVNFLENFTLQADNTCLSAFFESLKTTSDSTVHIWYYGDSQIEGDRITQDLRTLMQADFGGSGLGYIPFSDVASYRTIELKPGGSWLKLNCFTNKTPKGFGFAGKVFRMSTHDSNLNASAGIWISPKQQYQNLYLLYGNSQGGKIRISGKDSGKRTLVLPPTNGTGKFLLSSRALHGGLQFQLPGGTDYYGYLMDGGHGIQIDNCGIRGHSGDGLKFISDKVIVSQSSQLRTKLVVFHFGNNMIPYIRNDEKSMNYYQKEFEALFKRYRKLMPNASFLVICSGDMGVVRNGEAKSYPYIQEFTDMLRSAASNTGCAFFDMYALMQKEGGILGWKRKGLANLDGHLSVSGQMKFASALYNELMREYKIYKIIQQVP